jgi:uncharacterized protein
MPVELNVLELHEHVTCEILITNACNLGCSYCIARDLPGPPMSIEIGQKAIDLIIYLAEGGKSIEFIFSGGEPLAEYPVLIDLIEYSNRRGHEAGMQISFVLKTNGTILNSDILGIIQKYSIKVVVSIDGTQIVHDKHRITSNGKGTHETVCRNIKSLLENQVKCSASITVHPDTAQFVKSGVQWLYDLGVENMDIGPAYGTVEWSDFESSNLSQSLMDVADYVRKLCNNGHRINVSPIERESEHVGNVLSNRWGCHAASTNLAFLPNGNISGCSALAMLAAKFPELIIGDVFNGIDQLSTDNLIMLAQTGGDDRAACKGCQTASNCTGGCLAINYSTTGLAMVPPKVYCKTISAIPEAWCYAWGDR